jgi:hypothetical protein
MDTTRQKAMAHLALAWACPRCGAKTRRGTACQSPAIRGKARCRIHGGRSTGPSAEGRKRMSQANMVHGRYCRATVELRRMLAEERRSVREWLRMVEG